MTPVLLRQSLSQKLGELEDADIAQVLDFVDFLLYKQNHPTRHDVEAPDSQESQLPPSVQKLRTSRFIGAFDADPRLAEQSQHDLRTSFGETRQD
ncbi:MAG: hypothetical protein F6K09_34515 [Merismopedia sp. SIO2A8]|nr:hypothetical protein [Symploca sp. SIO2B6]NET53580.1 hypothetical protein [Merismopedia sp. SIO2A8]